MKTTFQKEIMGKYAQGGEESKVPLTPEAHENGLPFTPLEGKLEEALQAVKDFGKREFTIKFPKITSEVLFSVGDWTPVELQYLEPAIVQLEVVEDSE